MKAIAKEAKIRVGIVELGNWVAMVPVEDPAGAQIHPGPPWKSLFPKLSAWSPKPHVLKQIKGMP
jgi:hypothetical protein